MCGAIASPVYNEHPQNRVVFKYDSVDFWITKAAQEIKSQDNQPQSATQRQQREQENKIKII